MSSTTDYLPLNVLISSISTGNTTAITTSSAHYYVVGQLVRFHIAKPYGMRELDERLAYVTSVPTSTSFEIDVNSVGFSAFVPSPTYPGNVPAQVSPVGDRNNSTSGLTISGAFYNNT